MKPLPLSEVYALLEPGPVVLLSTAKRNRPNVMTMSWHMMVEFEPPMVACICSGANYSFEALSTTSECVIALPARKLAAKVVKVGNCSGSDTDKFKTIGLTPLPASQVKAPLIARRLGLAAQVSRTPCLLLSGQQGGGLPGTLTRWRVAAERTSGAAFDASAPGPPAWNLTLERCRGMAPVRSWTVEFRDVAYGFRLAPRFADRAAEAGEERQALSG